MCKYVYTRGTNKGKQCKVKPKQGVFCARHKIKTKNECSICYQEVTSNKIIKICNNSVCADNHKICVDCVPKLNNKCPFCRNILNSKIDDFEEIDSDSDFENDELNIEIRIYELGFRGFAY